MLWTSFGSVMRFLSPLVLLPIFAVLLLELALPARASGETYPDVMPGHTFPKDGVAPDARKIIYVIAWNHKKRVEEFGFQDYFKDADVVDARMAKKIQKAMEERYPNLVVRYYEVHQAEVKDRVEQFKNQKRVPRDHVDVKQPDKIEPPKRTGPLEYSYDGGVTKIAVEDLTVRTPPEFAKVESVQKDGSVILKQVKYSTVTKIITVQVIRDGKTVIETRNVPQQIPMNYQTGFRLKDEGNLDASGKTLRKEDVLARLKPGQTVLLNTDPKGIDPVYLAPLKPDTIILMNSPR